MSTLSLPGAAFVAALTLTIAGAPSPASRPRVTSRGTFYSKPYASWRGEALRQLEGQPKLPDALFDAPLALIVDVAAPRPKATRFEAPRPDLDNFLKAAMDALTKSAVWRDDVQVHQVSARKRWAAPGETPGYTITIGAMSA